MSEPTTERLAKAMQDAGCPADMIERARTGYYDDYKSESATPLLLLVQDLQKIGKAELAARVIQGDFDSTSEESEAWFKEEGADLMRQVFEKQISDTPESTPPTEDPGKEPVPDPNIFTVESMVKASDQSPAVKIQWGDNSGFLSVDEAIAQGMKFLEAAVASRIDAAVLQWAQQSLGMSFENAVLLRRMFRQKRESGAVPSLTMNLDGNHITPARARDSALNLLFMATHSEHEAFLAHFLIQDVKIDIDRVNQAIEDLRAIMGLKAYRSPDKKNKKPKGFGL